MTDGRLAEGNRDLGSAFALSAHIVVTASHVVGKAEAGSLVFRSAAGAEVHIERVEQDASLDVAVLFTVEAVDGPFAAAQARPGGSWWVTAQPLGNDPKLTGTITELARSVRNQDGTQVELLQLRVDQTVGNYKGYSGGAVLSGSGVVGVLVEQVPHRLARGPAEASNVLYALPIQQVLARFGLQPVAGLTSALAGTGEHATRIDNFLAEYLGPHVPFGGRQAELSALDDWLAGPTSYALITAEAGRGKSALLCHWAARVYAAGQADVIFVPISIRFRTADARIAAKALVEGLAAYHGEALTSLDRSAEQWQSEFGTYLRREPRGDRPLLVIVDGLDEAMDWQAGHHLFPVNPPPGVRVLVSARFIAGDVDESGWRNRLNWPRATSVALPPLSLDGVTDVLQAMGDPLADLVTQVDIVHELHRLSEGDPLLVRLYVESLLNQDVPRLAADKLPSIEKGLKGYHEHWLAEVLAVSPTGDVESFLNLLACSFGPLSRQDIAELNPEAPTGLALARLLGYVARFVIGDGADQGFVLSHPRFGTFFQSYMGRAEQTRWSDAFVDYGRRTFTDPSPYVLSFYGAHLEASEALSEDLYALVDSPWLAAWNAVDGTDSGFLNDCDRAWRRAEREGRLDVIFTCALARSSVASRSNKVPARLLVDAYREGLLTAAQALGICHRMTQDHQRARAVIELSTVLPDSWQGECVAVAALQQREGSRAHMIVELAPRLSGHALAWARSLAEALPQPSWYAAALAAVNSHLPEPERTRRALAALSILDTEPSGRARGRALMAMARFLPPEALSRAAEMARDLSDVVIAIRVLSSLARYMPDGVRGSVLDAALDMLASPRLDEAVRVRAMFALAEHLPELRRVAVQDADRWLPAEQAISLLLREREWVSEVVTDDTWRAHGAALTNVLSGQGEQAVVAVFELFSPVARRLAEPISFWGQMLVACGPDATPQELGDAVREARWLGQNVRPLVLTLLAGRHTGQSKRDLLGEALRAARTVEDRDERIVALRRPLSELTGPDLAAAQAFMLALAGESPIAAEAIDWLGTVTAPEIAEDALGLIMMLDHRGRVRALTRLSLENDDLGWRIDNIILDAAERAGLEPKEFARGLRTADGKLRAARWLLRGGPHNLEGLVDWLPEEFIAELVATLMAGGTMESRLLLRLLPRVPLDQFEPAVGNLLSSRLLGESQVADAVTAAYERLPDDARGRLLNVAVGPLGSGYGPGAAARIRQLSALVPVALQGQVVDAACRLDADEQVYVHKVLRRHYREEVIRPLRDAVMAADPAKLSARALAELAGHYPAEHQQLLIDLALTAAMAHLRVSDQVENLRALFVDAPPAWRPELVGKMISMIEAAPVDARPRLVRLILPILPTERFAEVAQLAETIADRTRRIDVLRRMASSDPDLWRRVVQQLWQSGDDLGQELLFVLRHKFNAGESLARALRELVGSADPDLRLPLLIALYPHVPVRDQESIAAEALRAATGISKERDRSLPEVAQLCTGFPALRLEALRIVARTQSPKIRLAAITKLAAGIKHWQEADRTEWNAVIRVLAGHPRPDFVRELSELVVTGAPGASAAEASNAFVVALRRVGEWWD